LDIGFEDHIPNDLGSFERHLRPNCVYYYSHIGSTYIPHTKTKSGYALERKWLSGAPVHHASRKTQNANPGIPYVKFITDILPTSNHAADQTSRASAQKLPQTRDEKPNK
jgi:hypothetical protein